MITVKMSELLNSTETLQSLAQKSLKAKLAFQVGRMLKAADKEIQDFNETRMKVITKYGEKDENGELITDENNNCKIDPNSAAAFNTEFNELLNSEIEINANKIKVEDLENLDFTPSEMINLEPFIEMDE